MHLKIFQFEKRLRRINLNPIYAYFPTISTFRRSGLFLVKVAKKFRNLQIIKFLAPIQTEFFQSFQGYVHVFEIYIV